MKQPTFIRIEDTYEKALTYKGSPQMEQDLLSFFGVQLLPNQSVPYIQRTYCNVGVEIESYIVRIKDFCGNTLEDITNSFEIVRTFNDPDTGLPQIEWQLSNIPVDTGYKLIYLEIEVGLDTYYYTSPFVISDVQADFTNRIDYRNNNSETMLSTQLILYFKQEDDEMEVEVYTTVNTGRIRNNFVRNSPFEIWNTGWIDIKLFRLIKNIFLNQYVYVDFQRTMLKEAFETPKLQMDENFAEQELKLVRNEDELYNPDSVPTPPPPPVYEIVLQSVGWIPLLESVTYVFELLGGFNANYLILEVSNDNINFNLYNETVAPAVSPQMNNVPFANLNSYWYRISYPPLNLVSNTLQLTEPRLLIIGANRISSTEYDITWETENYVPVNQIRFDYSNDNAIWRRGSYSDGNELTKRITTLLMSPEPTYFRIQDEKEGIISNTFEL
jgi:hypothetical protein